MKAILMAVAGATLIAGCNNPEEPKAQAPAIAPSIAAPPVKTGPSWELVKKKDEMTDEPRVMAQIFTNEERDRNILVVRCTGRQLEVLAAFDQYLGNDSRPVKYRMDQQSPQEETWSVSAKGTAVFASENADFSRQLMASKKVLIEATDYRGVSHRTMYEWASGAEKIGEVLSACGRSVEGLESKVPGLRKQLALELERWGPKNIEKNKRTLAAISGFAGEINDQMTPDFALAVQSFSDSYVDKCKAGKVRGANCESIKTLAKYGSKISLPVGPFIYEQAPKSLKNEMGDLRITD